MILTDMPFDFKRLQFRVRLTLAMTINKSQGQVFAVLILKIPAFRIFNYTSPVSVSKNHMIYLFSGRGT